MQINLKAALLIICLNLNLTNYNSPAPINIGGLNFEPIKSELTVMLSYAQSITTIVPQIITLLPEINVIANGSPKTSSLKEVLAYTSLVLGLTTYFYYNNGLNLNTIQNDINQLCTNAQLIAALIPQVTTSIEQIALIDDQVNLTNTLEQQLAYTNLVMGLLIYYNYVANPF